MKRTKWRPPHADDLRRHTERDLLLLILEGITILMADIDILNSTLATIAEDVGTLSTDVDAENAKIADLTQQLQAALANGTPVDLTGAIATAQSIQAGLEAVSAKASAAASAASSAAGPSADPSDATQTQPTT